MALSTRLASAWLTSSRLPLTGAGRSASTLSAMPFSSASGSYSSPMSWAISAASNSLMSSRAWPGFGARDHQQRVEGADQPVGFLDRRFQRGAVFGLALGGAQRLLGAIAQAGERRLEIVRDIVGDLLQAAHQRLDALEHGVEVFRQPVEFVAGAGDRQPLAEIAGHDGAGGLGHGVDAAQHAAGDEQPAGQARARSRWRPTSARRRARCDRAARARRDRGRPAGGSRREAGTPAPARGARDGLLRPSASSSRR